ncbi:hypothetical protein SAE02_69690 [Skermanella aerolata]|uniref:Uncharacterized protein n=1 Tax=Skermanella aerolata TaxID=393310 RepID=A0A512E266_9PROT|nr:hypothetical protein [Skermanella aerolata]KJB91243.1 hypothetical protein N826_31425 [Skermanella aerolata KACC 11604]GEO42821.1 hypothetical protein SAE02_69690 [Skermanella aerolata]
MSDFKVHPVLKSPAVAAVFFGIVASGLFNVGIADGLRAAGQSQITVEDWAALNQARYIVELMTAGLAGFSWWLFRIRRDQIKVPAAGVALGLFGFVFASVLIWSLLTSFDSPDYAAAADITWRFAYLWSALAVLSLAACVRLALWSYQAMRGAA